MLCNENCWENARNGKRKKKYTQQFSMCDGQIRVCDPAKRKLILFCACTYYTHLTHLNTQTRSNETNKCFHCFTLLIFHFFFFVQLRFSAKPNSVEESRKIIMVKYLLHTVCASYKHIDTRKKNLKSRAQSVIRMPVDD